MAKNTLLKKLKTIKKKKLVGGTIKIKDPEVAKYKQLNGMNLLEGDDALLLAEACKLDKTKKAAEKRLKAIKTELDLDTKGDYTNKAGDVVKVSISPKKSDVDPSDLFDKLVEQKRKSKFWSCVKVQLGPLKKVLVEADIEAMQFDLDDVVKCSYK